jgi:hypothetical protein
MYSAILSTLFSDLVLPIAHLNFLIENKLRAFSGVELRVFIVHAPHRSHVNKPITLGGANLLSPTAKRKAFRCHVNKPITLGGDNLLSPTAKGEAFLDKLPFLVNCLFKALPVENLVFIFRLLYCICLSAYYFFFRMRVKTFKSLDICQ